MQDHIGFVLNDPFHGLAFAELESLGDRRGEVNIVLISRFFAVNQLNFCWMAHRTNGLAYMLEHSQA